MIRQQPFTRTQMTAAGKAALEEELNHLIEVRRREVGAWVNSAREGTRGDLADAAELAEAQSEQAMIEGRIRELERILSDAEIVGPPAQDGTIGLGSTVTIRDEDGLDAFTIVGSIEAAVKSGRISSDSPVGQAVIGRRVGDMVSVQTPAGIRELEIVKVE